MEEGVTGEHVVAMAEQPLVDGPLLVGRRVQLVPDLCPPARRSEAGEAQLGVGLVGQGLELVELIGVVTGQHDRQLETGESGILQPTHGRHDHVEGAGTTDCVVDLGGGPVEGQLDVDVVAPGQAPGDGVGDAGSVGRELHAHAVVGGVVDELPEVGADGGLAAADIHVEDLHAGELVDEGTALIGDQLAPVAPPGARQTMHTGQIAGVGQLPCQTDGGVEPTFEVVDETAAGDREGEGRHRPPLGSIIPEPAKRASACR